MIHILYRWLNDYTLEVLNSCCTALCDNFALKLWEIGVVKRLSSCPTFGREAFGATTHPFFWLTCTTDITQIGQNLPTTYTFIRQSKTTLTVLLINSKRQAKRVNEQLFVRAFFLVGQSIVCVLNLISQQVGSATINTTHKYLLQSLLPLTRSYLHLWDTIVPQLKFTDRHHNLFSARFCHNVFNVFAYLHFMAVPKCKENHPLPLLHWELSVVGTGNLN